MYVVTEVSSSPRRKITAPKSMDTNANTSDTSTFFLGVWNAYLLLVLCVLLAVFTCKVNVCVSVCIYASWSLIWHKVQT